MEVSRARSQCVCSLTCGVGGKSAVLTAITVALGGKATSTGRGNGLKAFIREGQLYELSLL
jgi:hypothetical protein